MAYLANNYATHTLTFNVAFTNTNTINLLFGVTRVGNTAVSGNAVDDDDVYEISHWSTGASIGMFDYGLSQSSTALYISYYWRATGY